MAEQTWLPGSLLGRLEPVSRQALLALGVRRRIAAGHAILREGRLETHVVLLCDAVVKVTASMSDGRQALLSIRMSGDLVGEISALNGSPRSATVTACRESLVRIIHRADFRSYLSAHSDAAIQVAGIVADRLRWANRRRVDFASYSVKVRLARVLAEIAHAYGHRVRHGIIIDVSLTQTELATMCGAADISLRKALRELREAGIVDTGYRRLTVRDPLGLRDIADAEA